MNTLTNLIPSLYAGMDTVSRELVGFVPSVARNATAERAAVGQNVTYHVAPAGNVSDISPAMQVPEPTDQDIGHGQMQITKSRAAEFGFVGEQELGLNNNGPGYNPVQADMFAQGLRALVNEIESDLAGAAVAGTSRAYGTPGTRVFQKDTEDMSQLNKILADNGAPFSERNFVVDTAAGASLRTLHGINIDRDYSATRIDQQGVLLSSNGMAIRESGQSVAHESGDADGATTDGLAYDKGAQVINLASAGTGGIKAGDVIQFAGDSELYVVESGNDNVGSGGSITIQEPGLMRPINDAAAITVVGAGNGYDAAGVAFHRNAIVLAARAPALPNGGDMAMDRMTLTDPRSGLSFEVATYPGYRKVRYEVSMSWGVKCTQPRHTALLLR